MSGDQAFPGATADGFVGEGMSLRDWFAGQALPSVLTAASTYTVEPSVIARATYEIADAMLAERTTPIIPAPAPQAAVLTTAGDNSGASDVAPGKDY